MILVKENEEKIKNKISSMLKLNVDQSKAARRARRKFLPNFRQDQKTGGELLKLIKDKD